jgi:lipopolysaccharide export system protein LptC
MTVDHDIGPSAEVIERRRRAAERWRRRSRSIHAWRRTLPIVIGVMFLALVLWLVGRGVIARLTAPHQSGESVVRMTNPRFFGRDASNHAFVVAAKSAERRQTNTQKIILSDPTLQLESATSGTTNVVAARGVYDEHERKVALEGGVRLTNGPGYDFTTPRALIDTQAGVVTGGQGVQGIAPLGHIAASSYGVYDRGHRVVFRGGVRAQIDQSAVKTQQQQSQKSGTGTH